MIRVFFASILVSFLSISSFAQELIPLESWRMHISYSELVDVAEGNNRVYAAAKNGLFYFDRDDNSLNTITKLDGLSDVSITTIAYSDENSSLIVGYENGNLDILKNNDVLNITTVLNASISESKRINHFYISGTTAYTSTDFGLVLIDTNTGKIIESAQKLSSEGTNLEILESTIKGDSIYLATSNGVISTSILPENNLLDYNNWKRYLVFNNQTMTSIVNFKNTIFSSTNDAKIYSYNVETWNELNLNHSLTEIKLTVSNQNLLIKSETEILLYDGSNSTSLESGQAFNRAFQSNVDNSVWLASANNGLVTNLNGSFESYMPIGPSSNKVGVVYYHDNKVFAAPGGIGINGFPLQNNQGFYVFEDGFWTNYTPLTIPVIPTNLIDITFNLADSHYYLASYGQGLLKFNYSDKSFEVLDASNSNLGTWSINPDFTLVSSLESTQYGLWVANYGAGLPLHLFGEDEIWSSYSETTLQLNNPVGITIAENNDKWLILDQNGGIAVFNETSGKLRFLDDEIDNGELPNKKVYDIAIDKDGLVWVATERGVAYFSSSYSVENNNAVEAFTPIVDGFALLREERVNTIAIDGGNRKWFGTDNGLWLFDESALNSIYYFNTENSPLLSNNILDITIHGQTGEVFIATENGLVSFRSSSSEGFKTHQNVQIFPNPVTAEYNGLVGILGLSENAIVKITDTGGNLIRQMRAYGGTASWDINDYNGRRASSGMYVIYSSSEDGKETFVGKLAIID